MDADLAEVNALGEQLMQAGRAHEALALFDLAVNSDKENGLFINNRAVARAELGDIVGAVRDLEHAITFPAHRRLAALNYSAIGQNHLRFVRRALHHCREYLASGGSDEREHFAIAIDTLPTSGISKTTSTACAKTPSSSSGASRL